MKFKQSIANLSKSLVIFPLGLALLILVVMHQPNLPANFPPGVQISTWDWRNVENSDWNQLGSEFSELHNENFTQIYLDISQSIDYMELSDRSAKSNALMGLTQAVNRYVELATSKGLTVQALSGLAIGGNSSHRYIYGLLIDYIIDYNSKVNESAKLTGLQLNIEPYNQPGYADRRVEILTEYLDSVHEILEKVKDSNLGNSFTIGFTTPFWYDGTNSNETPLSWQGYMNYPVDHLLRELSNYSNSYLVILAYRNMAEGKEGSIELVRHEFEYTKLKNYKVKLLVGQETADVEPRKITYWGGSKGSLRASVTDIQDVLKEYSNFGGIAIHNLSSYLKLSN